MTFFYDKVERFGSDEFYIGARCIKVRIVGNYISLFTRDSK